MQLKWNTFSISLNSILSKNNSQSQSSFDNWGVIGRLLQDIFSVVDPSACQTTCQSGGCQRQISKGSYKNIYSDIISICTDIFSLLVNIEQRKWQTWYHIHVYVCQHDLSWLVAANDGWSESLILSHLHAFLPCIFNVLTFKICHDKIAEFTGTM